MSLIEYHRKRHFSKTPEPKGARASKSGRSFVIQKHQASHLHYDFRLELDGVLLSWAVPKGPNLDPSVKRLAMHVEDHPVDYRSFEGIIPQGEYGGGTVMLWDRGEWEPEGDPREGYRSGRLKFTLYGEKLHGRWMLVQTSSAARSDRDKRAWLLFKERDRWAKKGTQANIVETETRSVETGRTLEEIAGDSNRVWNSSKKPTRKSRSTTKAARTTKMEKSIGSRTSAHSRSDYDSAAEEFRGIRLTSPDKVLYPEDGITKLELASYYSAIAEWILPHMKNRPLVLVRCPEGSQGECFYQKHPSVGTPENLRQIPIRESSKTKNYVIVDHADGLISLTQIGALEIHAWGSRADKLEFPDRLIFDLDPDLELAWERVVEGARQVRQFLADIGLESFVKTTGGKGLHVVVPIERQHDWDEAKAFCKRVAEVIVMAAPSQYTSNMSKAARGGKIFIDYLRNGRGSTAVLPYSTRARAGATVSVPLSWKELSSRIRPDQFTIRTLPRRLSTLKHDPWEAMGDVRQSLGKPLKELAKLPAS